MVRREHPDGFSSFNISFSFFFLSLNVFFFLNKLEAKVFVLISRYSISCFKLKFILHYLNLSYCELFLKIHV